MKTEKYIYELCFHHSKMVKRHNTQRKPECLNEIEILLEDMREAKTLLHDINAKVEHLIFRRNLHERD